MMTKELKKVEDENLQARKGLNINADNLRIAEQGIIIKAKVSELDFALGKNSSNQQNPRNSNKLLSKNDALKRNKKRTNEFSTLNLDLKNRVHIIAIDKKVMKRLRAFILDSIVRAKQSNLLIDVDYLLEFMEKYFKEGKKQYYVLDGNTLCQGIEEAFEELRNDELFSKNMRYLASYYEENELKVNLFTESVFEITTPKNSVEYQIELCFINIAIMDLMARYNYGNWNTTAFEEFYLAILRLLAINIDYFYKNRNGYANDTLIGLINYSTLLLLPRDCQKFQVNCSDISFPSLLLLKALTNQPAGQPSYTITDANGNTIASYITAEIYKNNYFKETLRVITSSFLTLNNQSDGLAHLKKWTESILRLQYDTLILSEGKTKKGAKERFPGITWAIEKSSYAGKLAKLSEDINDKIMHGITADRIENLYLKMEDCIKKGLLEYFKLCDVFEVAKNLNIEHVDSFIKSLKESNLDCYLKLVSVITSEGGNK